jgi:tartrate-resistant acid phosphatase type 5
MLGLRVLTAFAALAATALALETVDSVDNGGMNTLEEIEEAVAAFLSTSKWTPTPTKTAAVAPSTPTPTPTLTLEATPSALTPSASTPSPSPSPSPSSTPSQTFQTSRCVLSETSEKRMDIDCSSDRLRFIGLGDWGETTNTTGVLAVRDGLWKAAATGDYDFILAVGDNFYNNGVANTSDSTWDSLWFYRYGIGAEMSLPWVALLGNHDWYGSGQAQIDYGHAQERGSKFWMMPSKDFNIFYRNAAGEALKMVVVDTMTLNGTGLAWAKQEYANEDGEASLVLAVGHHHIYSQGGAGDNSSTAMVELNEVIQSEPQVRAYIAGHEHDMQYLRANGTDYFQIGGGGRTVDETQVSPGTRAEVVFYEKRYGFAMFDVDLAARVVAVTYNVYNTSGVLVDEITFTRQY